MDEFISDDDLLTFEGWLRYQAVDRAALTPVELEMWQGYFEDAMRSRQRSPTVGLMKLQPVQGEQKYAVAIQDGSNLWLTMWVRCSRKGEIFVMQPRGNADWDAHASYHSDGTFHLKSFGRTFLSKTLQPLTPAFRKSEDLGKYGGHPSGAVCDPKAFDGVVTVEPGKLGPKHGSVAIHLVPPGYEPKTDPSVAQRRVFPRGACPSLVITICRDEDILSLNWPDDFVKV
jgi:hypothetical protein